MITYEVSITVPNTKIHDFLNFLVPHMREMLNFKGFYQVDYAKELRHENKEATVFTVTYLVKSLEDLDEYFLNHAPKVRAVAIERFNNQLQFRRRILQKQEECFVA